MKNLSTIKRPLFICFTLGLLVSGNVYSKTTNKKITLEVSRHILESGEALDKAVEIFAQNNKNKLCSILKKSVSATTDRTPLDIYNDKWNIVLEVKCKKGATIDSVKLQSEVEDSGRSVPKEKPNESLGIKKSVNDTIGK
jgi:hypothetical protein